MPLDIGKWIRGAHLERIFNPEAQNAVPEINTVGTGITANLATTKIDEIAKKAVEIAEKIKEWVQNPIIGFLSHLLPSVVQDVEEKIKQYLPIAIAGLLSLKDPLAMEDALKQIKFSDNFFWDKFFHDLAVAIANVLADGQINFADLVVAIQFAKDEFFSNKQQ